MKRKMLLIAALCLLAAAFCAHAEQTWAEMETSLPKRA